MEGALVAKLQVDCSHRSFRKNYHDNIGYKTARFRAPSLATSSDDKKRKDMRYSCIF